MDILVEETFVRSLYAYVSKSTTVQTLAPNEFVVLPTVGLEKVHLTFQATLAVYHHIV